MIAAARKNIIVCIAGIPLAFAGIRFQGVDFIRKRIVKEKLRSELIVCAVGALGTDRKVDMNSPA